MLKCFRIFDNGETGKIEHRDLKRVAKELGENMTDDEIEDMIREAMIDRKENMPAEITIEEFKRIMNHTTLFK